MNERKYVAVSIKHTAYRWKFGMPCILWGGPMPSADNEPRRFGGYTTFLDSAERYAKNDFIERGYPADIIKAEPVAMCIDFCKKYRNFDTVLVEADDYAAYCAAACIPTHNGNGREG